jgi:hypothetical protein
VAAAALIVVGMVVISVLPDQTGDIAGRWTVRVIRVLLLSITWCMVACYTVKKVWRETRERRNRDGTSAFAPRLHVILFFALPPMTLLYAGLVLTGMERSLYAELPLLALWTWCVHRFIRHLEQRRAVTKGGKGNT